MSFRWLVGLLAVLVMIIAPTFSVADEHPNPGEVGEWSAPFWEGGSDPFDPPDMDKSARFATAVSVAPLPDGRIVYWSGIEGSEHVETAFAGEAVEVSENSRAKLLDLRSASPQFDDPIHERGSTDEDRTDLDGDGLTTGPGEGALDDMFCADLEWLYDGTLLITGGTEWRDGDLWGDQDTKVFNPRNDTFTQLDNFEDTEGKQMAKGRWYPTLVTLPDGRIAVFSGVEQLVNSVRPDPGFSQVKEVEVFDPATRTWSDAGASQFSLPLFSRMHLLPNGKIFFGGVGQTWGPFGETPDEATWTLQRFYNPSSQSFELKGPAKYGVRGGAFSTLLKLEPPYDTAEILIAGGTLGPSPSSFVATSLSEVVTIEGERVSNESGINRMQNRRWYSSGVLLPTGEVIALSGGDTDEVVDPGSEAAVRMAEIFDPEAGTWSNLSEASRERTYHNSAALLRDGTILVGGHSPIPAHYHKHDNPVTRANNFKDSTFEIYSPPYLFDEGGNPAKRPSVADVTPTKSGTGLDVVLGRGTKPDSVSELVLVRVPSATHTVDSDQRAVALEFSVTRSGHLLADLPNGGNGSVLPPGPYYLFALNGKVPSVAEIVWVLPSGDGKLVKASANPSSPVFSPPN